VEISKNLDRFQIIEFFSWWASLLYVFICSQEFVLSGISDGNSLFLAALLDEGFDLAALLR
jgi:hypothetical protein